MPSIITRIESLIAQEEGATMVEYGLMVGLIAIVCFVAVYSLGINILVIFARLVLTLLTGRAF